MNRHLPLFVPCADQALAQAFSGVFDFDSA